MANQNGVGAQNAAMYTGMNGGIMPSAGHYSDMQTLMQNMESLSGWLEQNRQEWAQVQDGIARVERLQVRHPHSACMPRLAVGERPWAANCIEAAAASSSHFILAITPCFPLSLYQARTHIASCRADWLRTANNRCSMATLSVRLSQH